MGSRYSQLGENEAELGIVLVGKIGVGKSAAGNTILGRKVFKTEFSPSSAVTPRCQKETGEFDGQTLAVVDTPGLFDTKKHEQESKTKISECISIAAPGPHVFLFVIQATIFNEEEIEAVKIIQKMFGNKSADYTLVLFTHGDDLEADGGSIEKIINGNSALHAFIHQCKGGYHVFNNRVKDTSQVTELLKKINNMVQRNGGRHYSNEMLTEAKEAVRKEEGDLRMVLVGKTGGGKSASGNTILMRKAFISSLSLTSLTSECQKETVEFENKILAVVDTPGLFDTKLKVGEVKREIARCISFAAPGPHVFLVVLKPSRFTEEEEQTVKILQEMFGEEASRYTMALFTHGDDLEASNANINALIRQNHKVCRFISQCGGGYHVFNNKTQDPSQVTELLKKINTMVQENGGTYYTKEMFQEAERAIEEAILILRKEHPNMTPEEARRKAEKDNSFIKNILGTTIGLTAGGALTGVAIEVATGAAVGSVAGPVGAAAGAAVGAAVGLILTGSLAAVGKKKACKIQ